MYTHRVSYSHWMMGIPVSTDEFTTPNCLVHRISQNVDYTVDEYIEQQINECTKISLLNPSLTWIIWGFEKQVDKVYMSISNHIPAEEEYNQLVKLAGKTAMPHPPEIPNDQEWKRQQEEMEDKYNEDYPDAIIVEGMMHRKDKNQLLQRIVPPEIRDKLIDWNHEKLFHASYRKVLKRMKFKYFWKTMNEDIRKRISKCPACALLNAKRNLAHKHYRAKLFFTPRSAYAADYYGVYPNKQGYNNILGIIDLATGYAHIIPTKGRSAETTAAALLYKVILVHGVPQVFHSDAAQEFLSKAMKNLCTIIGCSQTNTKAHNPQGNAKIERMWQFVNKSLRQMNDDMYHHFDVFCPLIQEAWNTTPNEKGITPFELNHGMKARSLADSYTGDIPPYQYNTQATDISTIMSTAKALNQIAAQHKISSAKEAADILNSKGVKYNFKVGDQVAFYYPPTDKEAKKRGRKAKHLLQFRGPATIEEVLSSSNASFKLKYNERNYSRSVINLRPYKAEGEFHVATAEEDDQITVGSYLAVIDDPNDQVNNSKFHLAQVTDITDERITVWYMSTTAKKIKSAKWKYVYVEGTGRFTNRIPTHIARQQARLTCPALDDECIMVQNVQINKHNQIKSSSIRKIREKGLVHHRLGTTWPLPLRPNL